MRGPNPYLRLLTTYVVVATLLVSWLVFTQPSQTSETGLASHRSITKPVIVTVRTSLKPTSPTRSSWKHYGLQKPTPKPTPKPPPVVLAAPGTVQARIVEVWPGDDRWAVLTAECESGFNPRATNGQYLGIWQMGRWARSVTGGGDPRQQSVATQTLRAWKLIKMASSSQWECSPYGYNP